MNYEKNITVAEKVVNVINNYLTVEPTCKEECLSEEETYTFSVQFDNGFIADIKVCGVQYDETNNSNLAWTEGILFNPKGGEECCIASEDFLGKWELETKTDTYIINVVVA